MDYPRAEVRYLPQMVGAVEATCDVAQRIIGRLKEGAAAEGPPLSALQSANTLKDIGVILRRLVKIILDQLFPKAWSRLRNVPIAPIQ